MRNLVKNSNKMILKIVGRRFFCAAGSTSTYGAHISGLFKGIEIPAKFTGSSDFVFLQKPEFGTDPHVAGMFNGTGFAKTKPELIEMVQIYSQPSNIPQCQITETNPRLIGL